MRAGELDERTRAAAGALAELGASRGDRVCWEAESTFEAVVVALAVLRLGAVLVPLSPGQSERERRTVLEDITPRVVISSPEAARFKGVVAVGAHDLEGDVSSPLAGDLSADELALVVYTSGTTGRPKGAMLTHGNLAAGLDALIGAWEASESDHLVRPRCPSSTSTDWWRRFSAF